MKIRAIQYTVWWEDDQFVVSLLMAHHGQKMPSMFQIQKRSPNRFMEALGSIPGPIDPLNPIPEITLPPLTQEEKKSIEEATFTAIREDLSLLFAEHEWIDGIDGVQTRNLGQQKPLQLPSTQQ